MSLGSRSLVLALLVGLVGRSSIAEEPAKFRLALKNAADAARRSGAKSVLIVVRPEATAGQVNDTQLAAMEARITAVLNGEANLKIVTTDPAQELARKQKARRAMQPNEAREFKATAGSDAVLCVDLRDGQNGDSVRLTLVDGDKQHFTETVALPEAGEAPAKPPMNEGGNKKNADKKDGEKKEGGPKRPAPAGGAAGGNGGQLLTAPPTNGASGYAVRQDGKSGTQGRATSEAQQEAAKAKAAGGRVSAGGGKTVSAADITTAPTKTVTQASSELSQRVLDFAVSRIGQQVGNGECWTLGNEALKAAGAKPARDYTFGTQVPLRDVRPGDILQFTTARFDEPGYYAIMGAPNHTAVVYSMTGDRVFMLHQNFNGKRTVSTFDIRFSSLTSGSLIAFRAEPNN